MHFWPLASANMQLKRYEASVEACRLGLMADPQCIYLRQTYGIALSAAGKVDEAQRVISSNLDSWPDSAQTYTAGGWGYWYLGELDTATTLFVEALRLDPKFPWQHEGLGIVRFDQGDWIQARELLSEALRLDSAMLKGSIILDHINRHMADYPGENFPSLKARRSFPPIRNNRVALIAQIT